MTENGSFLEFVRRIRAGDSEAASELVRTYEPLIRVEIRLRLRDPALRQRFDSVDVCQSVLASFFLRAAAGAYDLNDPADLRRLLVSIARNKLASQVRRHRASRRDARRAVSLDAFSFSPAGSEETPSATVAGRELLDAFRARLTPEERLLSDLRVAGHSWAAIAKTVSGTPDACRVQLERAVRRVSRELGVEEEDTPDE